VVYVQNHKVVELVCSNHAYFSNLMHYFPFLVLIFGYVYDDNI
jgi:hypothetical protein